MSTTNLRLLKTISGISRLTFDDQQFSYTIFPKHSIRYSQSWLYILRVSRDDKGGLGYKFVSHDLVAVIGYRNDVIYVMPISDETKGIALEKLCREIFVKTKKTIILRKIHTSGEQEKKIIETNILEDDFAPEKILQLKRLFISPNGAINPAAFNLIKKVKTFENLNKKLKVVQSLRNITKDQLKNFFINFPQKRKSYANMIEYLITQKNNPRYKIMIFLNGKKIQGLYIAEVYSLREMGLYCGLTLKEFAGETEWMDIYFFRSILEAGIQTLYLGGAENEGITNYITKLIPYNTSYFINTIAFADKKRGSETAVVIRPIKEDDFNNLAKIYKNAYNCIKELGENWTQETARQFIVHFYKRQPDLFFLAEKKGSVVGAIVAGIQPWWDGNHLVEGEIFIDPQFQHKGIGKKLLKHLFLHARNKYGAVSWDTFTHKVNNHPLEWYKKLGFVEIPQWTTISGDIATVLERLG